MAPARRGVATLLSNIDATNKRARETREQMVQTYFRKELAASMELLARGLRGDEYPTDDMCLCGEAASYPHECGAQSNG